MIGAASPMFPPWLVMGLAIVTCVVLAIYCFLRFRGDPSDSWPELFQGIVFVILIFCILTFEISSPAIFFLIALVALARALMQWPLYLP